MSGLVIVFFLPQRGHATLLQAAGPEPQIMLANQADRGGAAELQQHAISAGFNWTLFASLVACMTRRLIKCEAGLGEGRRVQPVAWGLS